MTTFMKTPHKNQGFAILYTTTSNFLKMMSRCN